ncbi:hypothetical protein ACTQ43_14745, partial [Segatella copri]
RSLSLGPDMTSKPAMFRSPRAKIGATRPTRAAVERIVAELGDLDGSGAMTAELARSAADLVDSAKRMQDAGLWLRASQRLEQLLAKLPSSSGEGVSADAEQAASGDSVADRLAAAVGRAPVVGDGEIG